MVDLTCRDLMAGFLTWAAVITTFSMVVILPAFLPVFLGEEKCCNSEGGLQNQELTQGLPPESSRCLLAVQQVPWNYTGSRVWHARTAARLCQGAEESTEPAKCFAQVMHGGVSWGGSARWYGPDAVDLCAGTRDAVGTITCFQMKLKKARGKIQAIRGCRTHHRVRHGGGR